MPNTAIDEHEALDASFAPIPVLRPREQVEEQLKGAILSGQLEVGSRLPSETVLAAEFSVSRTTVREALRSLATKGLIEKTPGAGGGSFVRNVDHWSLGRVVHEGMQNLLQLGTIQETEASDVRYMLEVPAARLAAQNRTEFRRTSARADRRPALDDVPTTTPPFPRWTLSCIPPSR